MPFNSVEFLCFFCLLLLLLVWTHKDQAQKIIYLIASYLFYMWWNPVFILLIIFSTAVDFFVGKKIADGAYKKRWLWVSICANLGLLAFFKYFGFFEENLLWLMRSMGSEPSWTSLNIILPVGISFYTFQTMSYSIDIYRGNLKPTKSFLDFAVFVSFFPQLVAGPIVRASEFLPQLEVKRSLDFSKLNLILIGKGLFKKVIIADNLAFFVDRIFENPELYPSAIIWIAAFCFSIQIYCDFSGYTDIAIGVAGVLGFKFPHNFNKPYFAVSPSDFWRRWHITLSRWLRDYLYISLGGNRNGTYMTYRNLFLTMLLGGLWHGASWNFVLWGFLHGFILIVYRFFKLDAFIKSWSKFSLPSILNYLFFQYFVILTWITFRVEDFDKMWLSLKKFVLFDFNFNFANLGIGTLQFFSTVLLLLVFCLIHLHSYRVNGVENQWRKLSWSTIYIASIFIGFLSYFFIPTQEMPFIYFQF